MTRPIEFEGKNIDQAVEKACKALGVEKEELQYDVLSYGSTGIFGLVGSKKARIRVTPPAPSARAPVEAERVPPEPEADLPEAPPSHPSGAAASDQETVPDIETVSALGEEVLKRILDSITEDTHITVETNPEGIFYNVRGGNSALLIGKRGQTLDAIQYVVEKIVRRKTERRIRVFVDIEGYKENRRISLQRLAERVSEKVKRTGRPVTLGDMNASDRRIIHVALKDNREVRTQSRGSGALKKLSIFPKKKPLSKS